MGLGSPPQLLSTQPAFRRCGPEKHYDIELLFSEESENQQLDPKLFSFLLMVFVFILCRTFVKVPPNLSCGTKR